MALVHRAVFAEGCEMTCIFCEIVKGNSPATVFQAWDDAIAIKPLVGVHPMHALIIPKTHVKDFTENLFVSGRMMYLAGEYAKRWGFESANVVTSMGKPATQSIFHLHIHVVPRYEDDELMLPWGSMFGEDPSKPHWCRIARDMDEVLSKYRAEKDGTKP